MMPWRQNLSIAFLTVCVTQFNHTRGYSLFTRGGGGVDIKMIGWQNPTQFYGRGAYKIPHLLMRVVRKSISLVYCRDCLFKKIATTWHISLIYMQFHFFQCWFFLKPYFSNISIIMCLEIRGYPLIIGWEWVHLASSLTHVRLPPRWVQIFFITPKNCWTPYPPTPIGTFCLFKDIVWPTSSSLLLIEVKSCWSSKAYCPIL